MKTLEQLIAEAVQSGGLAQLTLHRGPKGWQGNARREGDGTSGWRCMTADDPVRALRAALTGPVSAEVVQSASPATDEDIFG